MADVKRTLTYRRAVWAGQAGNQNLQNYVSLIHQNLTATQHRTFDYSGGQIIGLAWTERDGVALGHIAQYVHSGATSLVPLPSGDPSANTVELPPPGDSNFLRGDIMLLVAENHLLMCPSGAREAVIGAYLESASDRAGIGSWASQCRLESVADVSKIQLIRAEGVKRIRLNASLYEASLAYEEARSTVRRSVIGHFGEAIREYFSNDPELASIGNRENISVRIEIAYDGRRKGGVVGQERMESLARHLVDEDEEGFEIVTRDEKVIRSNELRIRQVLPLEGSGSTVSRDAAWRSLMDFYRTLRSTGALEI